MMKKILLTLTYMLTIPTIIFAETKDTYSTLAIFLKVILNSLMYVGFVIAIGALILLGIKYLMSGANERANLKDKFPKYIMGIVFITMCSTIAAGVANIANFDGKTTPENIIKDGFEISGIVIEGQCEHDYSEPVFVSNTSTSMPEGYEFYCVAVYKSTCKKCGEEKKEYKLVLCDHSTYKEELVRSTGKVRSGDGRDWITNYYKKICDMCEYVEEYSKSGPIVD